MRRIPGTRTLGAFALAVSLATPSLALAQQEPVPPRHYADGTGNNMIDQLNATQLNDNYKGPYYHRGEPPPPFRPLQVPPPPPPPPPPAHAHRPPPHPHSRPAGLPPAGLGPSRERSPQPRDPR